MTHVQFLEQVQANKHRQKFKTWYYGNDKYKIDGVHPLFELLPESFQLAALVDFFDSEGVYICPMRPSDYPLWACNVLGAKRLVVYFETRTKALQWGILAAFDLI